MPELPRTFIRVYHHPHAGGYILSLHCDGAETATGFPDTPSELVGMIGEMADVPVVCREQVANDLGAIGFDPDDTRIIII